MKMSDAASITPQMTFAVMTSSKLKGRKKRKNPRWILKDHVSKSDLIVGAHTIPEPLRHSIEDHKVVTARNRAGDEHDRIPSDDRYERTQRETIGTPKSAP
jgi:hypothetical protein